MPYHFLGPQGPLPALMEEAADHDPRLWRLLDLVDQLDLSAFERFYRSDGSGGRPYDPRLMLVSVWWCYQQGVRSPGAIAVACRDRIALRVLFGGARTPSRSTVERFIQHHRHGGAQVNVGLLRACEQAGLTDVSTTATDSTPVAAPAALSANRGRARIRLAIAETEQALDQIIDQVQQWGRRARCGDIAGFVEHGCGELLEQERRLRRRLIKLRTAETIAEQREQRDRSTRAPPQRALQSRITHHRHDLQAMTARQQQACDAYQAKVADGRKPRGPAPRAPTEHPHIRAKQARLDNTLSKLAALPPAAPTPGPRANLTAASSRILKGKNTTTWVQGDLLTITVGTGQIILAAELPDAGNDHGTLHPHLSTVATNCRQAGITTPMLRHLADAGYASETVFNTPTATGGTLYIAVTNEHTQTSINPPKPTITTTGRAHMAARLATAEGTAIYQRRSPMIEPVFAQLLRTDRRLHTRGPGKHTEITAMATAHNANKYLRTATPPPTPIWVLAKDPPPPTN